MQTTSSPTSSRRSRARRASALALWLALSAVLVLAAFYGQASEETSDDEALYDPSLAVNGLFLYGLMIGLSVAIARLFRRPYSALGFRRFRLRWVWIGFGVVFATLVLARILEPFLHGGAEQGFAPDRWQPEHATAFAVNSAVVILLGPFAEEVFFRGLGVRVLALWGAAAAVIGSAVVFGLVHGIFGALPPLVFFGLGLAWIRLRSASVWPGFIAHAGYNALGILLLVVAWALDVQVD
jgi:membrane protease YdiL (CAAX protease family)